MSCSSRHQCNPPVFISLRSSKQQHLFCINSISRAVFVGWQCWANTWWTVSETLAECLNAFTSLKVKTTDLSSCQTSGLYTEALVSELQTCRHLFLCWQCSVLRSSVTHTALKWNESYAWTHSFHGLSRGGLCILEMCPSAIHVDMFSS